MADDYARGEKLVYLRKKKRLTQAAAAFLSGFSDKTIRSWEKDGPIKWKNAQKYAEFLGVDPESIVTRDLRPPVEPEDIEAIKRQLEELVAAQGGSSRDAAAAAKSAKPPRAPTVPKRRRRSKS